MLKAYFDRLSDTVSQGWNRFWFDRDNPRTVCVLRIVVGIVAFLYALTFTTELAVWFAEGGVLPVDRTYRLTGANDPSLHVYYWSLFYLAESTTQLYALHAVGVISILLFAVGFQTRYTSIVAAIFVLSYAMRAPMLTGLLEPMLCPAMLYLCLAPCGAYYSIDAWLRRRSSGADKEVPDSFLAHLATRLIQVHVGMLYLMMAAAKLGSMVWWNGEAMWWLIAQPDNRLVDLTFLRQVPLVVFGWTHVIVLFELLFGLLIWFRIWRPLLCILAVLHWLGLALVTGHWEFAMLMTGLSAAFAPWAALAPDTDTTRTKADPATAPPKQPARLGA